MFLIEGLPGSGKTTYAKKLKEYLSSNNIYVEQYNEGDLHPIDLAWCSITSNEVYNSLLKKHDKYKDQIINQSKKMDGRYITAYTKLRVEDEDVSIFKDFEPYEIYKTNDFNYFKQSHLDLWRSFTPQKNTLYIFECIYLQNHINELILKFNLQKSEITKYFQELIDCVRDSNPVIIYIKQNNVNQTLNKTIKERTWNSDVYKDWIDLVIEYFEGTTFGKELGYTGYEGAIQYFVDRQALELDILNELDVEHRTYELDTNYDIVFEQIMKDIKL